MKPTQCPNCNQPVELTDKFCQKCGSPIPESSEQKTKTFKSSGNYSGTMIKGKGSGTRKIIRNIIIAIVLIGIIAFIIWIKTDPDAKEKLGNILFGFVVMAIFAFVVWRKSKKGLIKSSKNRVRNYDWDDNVEPEIDNDDDDDDN